MALGEIFASLVGTLAESFRLGRAGYPNRPPGRRARPRLFGLHEIIGEMRTLDLLPTRSEGERLVWRYVCYYVDVNTGQRMSGTRVWTIETDLLGTAQRASAAARRRMILEPSYLTAEYGNNPAYRLVCKSIGDPWVLPTQDE